MGHSVYLAAMVSERVAMKTLYDLLGVRQDADAETVRSAFRRAVKAHHPDLHVHDADAAERLREIIAANAILRDAEQRAAYDQYLRLERQRRWSEWKRAIVQCSIAGAVLSVGLVAGSARFVPLPKAVTVAAKAEKDAMRESAEVPVVRLAVVQNRDHTTDEHDDAKAVSWTIGASITPPPAIISMDRKLIRDEPPVDRRPGVDAKLYSERGIAAYRGGDLDRALADFDLAIRQDRNDAQAYRNRGKVWEDRDDHDRALADYDEAIRLDPNNPEAFHERGLVWRRKGELDSALIDLDRAIRFSFADAGYYCDRGLVWYEKGRHDRALADFNQAIKINPNFAAAYIDRGITLRARGDLEQASADFDRATKIDPNSLIVIQRANFEPLKAGSHVQN
jgi:tetratricopeptide (TPR) repeat protein